MCWSIRSSQDMGWCALFKDLEDEEFKLRSFPHSHSAFHSLLVWNPTGCIVPTLWRGCWTCRLRHFGTTYNEGSVPAVGHIPFFLQSLERFLKYLVSETAIWLDYFFLAKKCQGAHVTRKPRLRLWALKLRLNVKELRPKLQRMRPVITALRWGIIKKRRPK